MAGRRSLRGPPSSSTACCRPAGVDPKRVGACEDALRLALKLEEGKRLRFSIGGGTVNIDVPKLDERPLTSCVPKICGRHGPALTVSS